MTRARTVTTQAMRYGIVGAIVVACDYLVFTAILLAAPAVYLAANLGGKVAGALLGFFLHRHFTFSWEQRHGARRQFVSYCAVLLGNIALSTALLWLLVEQVQANAFLARIATDAVVIVVAFLPSRLWVYRAA